MKSRNPARGYTLVALMVGLTIMSVLIAAVLPLASTEMQRDREDELIFRGRQYAEGLRVFRRRYGRYPTTLREMYEVRPRALRKLWKDPIRNSEEWGLITALGGAPVPGVPQGGLPGGPGGAGGTKGGGTFGGFGGSGFGGSGSGFGGSGSGFGGSGSGFGDSGGTGGYGPGGVRHPNQPTPTPTAAPTPDANPFPTPSFGGSHSGSPDQAALGPVTGVYSLSQKKALRLYEGRDVYSEWRFTEQSLLSYGGGPDLGGPGGPGLGGTFPSPPGGPVKR